MRVSYFSQFDYTSSTVVLVKWRRCIYAFTNTTHIQQLDSSFVKLSRHYFFRRHAVATKLENIWLVKDCVHPEMWCDVKKFLLHVFLCVSETERFLLLFLDSSLLCCIVFHLRIVWKTWKVLSVHVHRAERDQGALCQANLK